MAWYDVHYQDQGARVGANVHGVDVCTVMRHTRVEALTCSELRSRKHSTQERNKCGGLRTWHAAVLPLVRCIHPMVGR